MGQGASPIFIPTMDLSLLDSVKVVKREMVVDAEAAFLDPAHFPSQEEGVILEGNRHESSQLEHVVVEEEIQGE